MSGPTLRQREFLEHLRDKGPVHNRRGGNVALEATVKACARRKWCLWRPGPPFNSMVWCITDLGRAVIFKI